MKKTKASYEEYISKYEYGDTQEAKDDFEKVRKFMKQFRQAQDWRKTSCDLGGEAGTDWNKHWEYNEKFYLNWYKPSNADNFRSNVKLGEASGRVDALYNKMRNAEIGFTISTPRNDESYKTKCLASYIDYELYRADASEKFALVLRDAIVKNTGIYRTPFLNIKRTGRFAAKPNKDNPEDIKKVKEKKPLYEEREYTVYNGLGIIHINREDFYESPKSFELHGTDGVADYVIWRRVLTYEQFMEDYGKHPYAKNIDKVKVAKSQNKKEDVSMFDIEDDVTGKKYVLVFEYENEKKDQYMVIANDQLVLDVPMLYDHKHYTFHKVDCIKRPGKFNGISLVDRLENVQVHMEVLMNMMLDKNWRQLNQKYFIENTVFGELTERLIAEDSLFIPVNTSDGRPLTSKVAPLYNDYVNQDSFQLMNTLGRYAVMGSLMDTNQLNLQKTNVSATATQLSTNIVEEMITSLIKNMHVSLTHFGRDLVIMLNQKRKIHTKKKISFPLKDYAVVTELGKTKIKREWNKTNWMEVDPDLFSIVDETIDIRVSPKSLQVNSKINDREEFKVIYPQMMPHAVDPTDPASQQTPGVKLYDARRLAKKMVDLNNLDEETLLMDGFDDDDDVGDAIEEVKTMMQGEYMSGIPGRSMSHNLYEKNVLDSLNNAAKNMQEQLELTKRETGFDMMGNPMPPQYDPQLMQGYEMLLKQIKVLSDHLQVDVLPKNQREAASLVVAQEVEQLQGMMKNVQNQPQPPQGREQQVPVPPSVPTMPVTNDMPPMPQAGM
jgi:hypothetical protein